jgi:hypothetical protein
MIVKVTEVVRWYSPHARRNLFLQSPHPPGCSSSSPPDTFKLLFPVALDPLLFFRQFLCVAFKMALRTFTASSQMEDVGNGALVIGLSLE